MAQLFPKTSLEQWRVLIAIVEYGSFAKAAQTLCRSQSSISYAVSHLQSQLGVTLLQADGRRMQLTPTGQALLHDVRPLLEGLLRLEKHAALGEVVHEEELELAVDLYTPSELLAHVLPAFAQQCPETTLQLRELPAPSVAQPVRSGQADLGLGLLSPPGLHTEWLLNIVFVAVAASLHPLATSQRSLGSLDLHQHRQIQLRHTESAQSRRYQAPPASRPWLVENLHTLRDLVLSGCGYAWLPVNLVQQDIERGHLRALPLKAGQYKSSSLYLLLSDQPMGPAGHLLADAVRQYCHATQSRPVASTVPAL